MIKVKEEPESEVRWCCIYGAGDKSSKITELLDAGLSTLTHP